MDESRELVGTSAAAATLGISERTLQRYAAARTVTPSVTLPSGQYRWDLDELARQTTHWRTSAASKAETVHAGWQFPVLDEP